MLHGRMHFMKPAALIRLYTQASAVLYRFPVLFACAVVSAGLGCYLSGRPAIGEDTASNLWFLLFVCNLLMTIGLSADLFSEGQGWSGLRKGTLRLGAVAVAAAVYAGLDPVYLETDAVRVGILIVAGHLLIAFAPFGFRPVMGDDQDFWHFNSRLFLRFLSATLYTLTLYAGLMVALFGLEKLFGLNIRPSVYSQLLAVLGLGFHPLFFLAGVPDVSVQETGMMPYPKGLKVFTQYVLIPLMIIYLGILLTYEVHIVLVQELPQGIVAMLILAYAVFGMLALLLVWPIKAEPGVRWVSLFARSFFVTLVPLLLLLSLAIYRRISSYGFTEERYILVVLGLWLVGITGYFLVSRQPTIRVIPVSLFILTVLSAFGPQGASAVSRESQQARLARLRSATQPDAAQLASVVTYLVDAHGLQAVQGFSDTDFARLERSIRNTAGKSPYERRQQRRDTVFALLNIAHDAAPNRHYLEIRRENLPVLPVSGVDYVCRIEPYQDTTANVELDGRRYRIRVDRSLRRVEVMGADTLVLSLDPLLREISTAYRKGSLTNRSEQFGYYWYPADRMRLTAESGRLAVVLVVDQLNGQLPPTADGEPELFGLGASLLFTLK